LRHPRGERCEACGTHIADESHAIQLAGGVFHAACVLYRPRRARHGAPGDERLARTR
jgi:hypothetical protein